MGKKKEHDWVDISDIGGELTDEEVMERMKATVLGEVIMLELPLEDVLAGAGLWRDDMSLTEKVNLLKEGLEELKEKKYFRWYHTVPDRESKLGTRLIQAIDREMSEKGTLR
jgi:hypothetical protein